MNVPQGRGLILAQLVAAAASGPATAYLHESDALPLGPTASLWPHLIIVLAAAIGIFFGLRTGRRGFPWLRWVAMMPNALVLCFYGFFLLFFGLGGSR